MNKYIPDRWIVIQITHPQTGETVDKVLAGWYGGYLGSDHWKLNSGITKVDKRSDRFEFHGSSGSLYVCYHACYGLTGLTTSVLNRLESMAEIKTLEEYDVRPEYN